MNNPGVWILGAPRDQDRDIGMGVVIEYANRTGAPQWITPAPPTWDYTIFGKSAPAVGARATDVPLVFRSEFHGHGDFEHWTINGKGFSDSKTVMLTHGTRYRLVFDNQSTDDHPVHLHRHRFEIVAIDHTPTAGVVKDVVLVPAGKTLEVEFTADNPGKTLFHCHMQDHMDFGFMLLFDYA